MTGTLSAREYTNLLRMALVLGTLEPGCLPLQDLSSFYLESHFAQVPKLPTASSEQG